jgi:2-polyprenyl-3-methyl-5-hydroxy-6-metoxy-1,4-benzoquinol methylase
MNEAFDKEYPNPEDLSIAKLEDNSSLKKMLNLIDSNKQVNKQVIDFGCATGYFARLLTQLGCQVTGVELNPHAAKIAEQYCESVLVADLDFVDLNGIFPEQKFDVAIFGDVLEHLRNPWKTLEKVQGILKPGGCVIASIPNIAHGAIRLALLQGQFEYTQFGILDNTHLRFFTRKTMQELFEQTGYFISQVETTRLPIFCETQLLPKLDRNQIDETLIRQIEQDEDADTLQFIVQAFPVTLEGKLAAATVQRDKFTEQVQQLQRQLQQAELESVKVQQQLQIQLEQSQVQLHDAQAQLHDTQVQLHDTQAQLEQSYIQLHDLQIGLDRAKTRIEAMESSKFWQLRKIWFKFKRSLGFKPEELG